MENHDLVRSQLTLCRGESLDLRDIVALEVHPRFPYAAAITERTGGAGATTSLVVIDLDNHRQNEFDLDGIHAVCWDHGDVTLHVARSTDDATTISRFSPKDGELTDPANVSGVIEGLRSVEQGLLALEAKVGAELSDVHGSGTVAHISTGETWAPRVLPGSRGRRVLRLLDGSGRWHAVTDKNVWEFDARAHALVAVASDGPGEGDWYGAELILVSYGRSSSPYHSAHQLAMPRLSADGKHWSVLAGPASDRGLLLGELIVDGRAVDLGGLHVSSAQWTPEGRLLVVGSHGMETEIVSVDLALSKSTTRWRSADLTSGELEPVVAAKADNDFLVVLEGHSTPPALFGFCTDGGPARLLDTRTASTSVIAGTGGCSNSVTWQSTDGMTIEGQLVLPSRGEVRALVVVAHGGPVAAFRPTWGARDEYTHLLVAAGYAVLQPNPRGSSGRGNSFAERVYGDVGGQDAVDIATGIDDLIREGWVPDRPVGITGNSYGGYLAAWMPCVCPRIGAAVSRSPVTDWQLLNLTTNLRAFDLLLVGPSPLDPHDHHTTRSPARQVSPDHAPTLLTAGRNDLATPASQAEVMYTALCDAGVPSVLVVYPEEGHGVRGHAARIDQCTRMLDWFDTYL